MIPIIIGFYSREEQGLWIEDLDAQLKVLVEEKARKHAASQAKSAEMREAKTLDLNEKHRGRTERLLDDVFEQHLHNEVVTKENTRAEQQRNELTALLQRLLNDKTIFQSFAAGPSNAKMDLRMRERESAANNKLDMPETLKLLKSCGLMPHPLISQKLVLDSFKYANKPDPKTVAQIIGRVADSDALQLDYDEFRVFVKTLAHRTGCVLAVEEEAAAVIKPEWRDALKGAWNNRDMFTKACVKPVDPNKKAKLDLGSKQGADDDNSMDFREFVSLIEKIGMCPEPFNKTLLAKVFKEVNMSGAADDLNDDAHEFSYEEYKTAMLILCSELGVPIYVNGRNIVQRVKL